MSKANPSKAKQGRADEAENLTAVPPAAALVAGPVSDEDYRAALNKAEKGDEDAMSVVYRAFAEKPERWRNLGDVAWIAKFSLARAAAGRDSIPMIEASLNVMEAKAKEMTPPDAAPLEKLLAERAALTWFEVHYLDGLVAQNDGAGIHPSALQALDERRDRADRRFRHAIKDLATVRRLLRSGPAVQVNAGVAQVNVGAPVAGGPG
jgi:hypothetical protein